MPKLKLFLRGEAAELDLEREASVTYAGRLVSAEGGLVVDTATVRLTDGTSLPVRLEDVWPVLRLWHAHLARQRRRLLPTPARPGQAPPAQRRAA